MFWFIIFIIVLFISLWLVKVYKNGKLNRQQKFIQEYQFPESVFKKFQSAYPNLNDIEYQRICKGLKQFFMAFSLSGYRHLSMPSRIADELWHTFILDTKHYHEFCNNAFGRFLHHSPNTETATPANIQKQNSALQRCWRYCCLADEINPNNPEKLPLLFRLDVELTIDQGFYYILKNDEINKEPKISFIPEKNNILDTQKPIKKDIKEYIKVPPRKYANAAFVYYFTYDKDKNNNSGFSGGSCATHSGCGGCGGD